ncbi:hypothetical protein MRX96_038916 [Rhipicephalus microplus]
MRCRCCHRGPQHRLHGVRQPASGELRGVRAARGDGKPGRLAGRVMRLLPLNAITPESEELELEQLLLL